MTEQTEEITNNLLDERIIVLKKELMEPAILKDSLASSKGSFQELRRTWPLWLQNGLRDSGLLGVIADTLTRLKAAPDFYISNPHCFPEFCRISGYPIWVVKVLHRLLNTKATQQQDANVNFAIIRYGPHSRQYAHVMKTANTTDYDSTPLIVFVHGGAWGTGFPTMYRLTALPFLEKGYRVAILGYRLYPDVLLQGQVDDIALGVAHLSNQYGNAPSIMIGHSSGAHTSVLAQMQGKLDSSNVIGLIGMAGVYNIEQHYEFECLRGVDQISPMKPCCGSTVDNFRQSSPMYINSTSTRPLLLLHGVNDTVSLPRESIILQEALFSKKNNVELALLDGVDHQDIVLQLALGGNTRETVLSW
eukprot:CAMPEP_0178895684 /NCGR_PEP_ID=MMETSP0786-20121207/726_1 /TAXON_ID=186022 /ORGANISM="Thalassionema frauenfeldii, Strain CCMP 1798" /LENGTH=360 /DNA_ID=CAMNT_0020565947 /DNA_START=129 /DNA_END=1208 /DNA_ORIENTATION=+